MSEEELLLDLWDLGWDMNYYNRRSHCQLMYTVNKAYASSNLCLKILHVYGHVKHRTSVSGRLATGTTLTHARGLSCGNSNRLCHTDLAGKACGG